MENRIPNLAGNQPFVRYYYLVPYDVPIGGPGNKQNEGAGG